MKKLLLSLAIVMAGCTSMVTTDPAQNALNKTVEACKSLNVAITGLDAAVVTGSVKKATAQKAAAGLTTSNEGCRAALATLSADIPASGVSK